MADTDGSQYDLDGWKEAVTRSATAILNASTLIWPQFVEIAGRVFPRIDPVTADDLRRHVEDFSGNAAQLSPTEAEMLGELDLGVNLSLPLTSDDDVELSLERLLPVLRDSWQSAAQQQFPDRRFLVRTTDFDGHSGPTISIFEIVDHLPTT